ncbi:MAG: hypothetical protein HYV04_22200, partial [Deltaproteobacteria bacterium]|nr:hypothetical protein [Deltaproteobacteria bacterium]
MSKKKAHEEELEKGLEALRRAGVEIEERSPAGIKTLESHLGGQREIDLAIVSLLGRIVDPASRDLLIGLEQRTRDKPLKKEIRRSLFKLAQKGIEIPRAQAEQPQRPQPVLSLEPEIEGYLSSVDAGGGRLVWLAKPQAGSGVQLLQGMVSDREGLIRAGGALVKRKELRRMARDIKEQHGITMISVPWQYADRLLYEAYETAKELGRGGIESYTSLRALFTSGKPQALAHPIYSRLDAEEARSGAWRELSRRLLDEPEFRPWVLDEDWMKPYLDEVDQAQQSRLVLNPLQKEERSAGILRDAVAGLFSGPEVKIFQRRMEDMALYLIETGREAQARLALAVGRQFAEGNLGALDISFLTGLAQKSLGFYLA